MVARISTLGQTNRSLAFTQQTQVRINDIITQISSGKKAQVYQGLSRSTNELINTENQILRNNEYMDSINIAQRRLDAVEDSTDTIFDLVTEFRKTLVQARNDRNYEDLPLNTLAQDLYEQVAQFLNVEQDNRFLFSGSRTNVQPVVDFERFQQNLQNVLTPSGTPTVSTFQRQGEIVAEPTAFLDVSALAAPDVIDNAPPGLGTGMPVRIQQIMDFLGFDTTDPNRQADGTLFGSLTNPNNINPTTGAAVSFGNDPAVNDIGGLDFKALYYQGDNNQLSARIEEDATVTYGITANQRAFEQVLTAAAVLALPADFDFNQANGGSGNPGVLEIEDRIDVALRLLEQAQKDALEPSNGGPNLTNIRTFIGSDIRRLDETEKRLTNFEVFFEETVAEIENTDITEAATLLSQNQLILESSFLSIAQISRSSLLNFLR